MTRLFLKLACGLLVTAGLVAVPVLAQSSSVQRAQSLLDQGKPIEALKQLDAAVAADPGNAEARFMRGIVLVQVNRADDAIKVFEQLTKDFPKLPEPYNNLAVLYAQQGNYDAAKNALLSAISTHPSYATAHENLGDIYSTLARQAYNRALELDAENEAARVKLAMLDRIVTPPPAGASQPSPASSQPAVASGQPPIARTQPLPAGSPAGDGLSSEQAVLGAVQNWSRAWENQDVNGYLNSYSQEFKPADGQSLRRWQRTRRERVSSPRSIDVVINNPEVRMIDAFTAQVDFRQFYRSDSYRDQTRKRLTMVNSNGRWLILREESL